MKKPFTLIVLALAMIGLLAAQTDTAKSTAVAAKKPVFGAACNTCPWGAMAQVVKSAMQFYGYDVQICHNCNAADAPRIVSQARMPPPYKVDANVSVDVAPPNVPGLGPIDFGATGSQFMCDAFHATGRYSTDNPMNNLRLIANIQQPPNYLIVAAKSGSGITDLSQARAKRWPLRVYAQSSSKIVEEVLAFYGLTVKDIVAAGGLVGGSTTDPSTAPDPTSYDVIIHMGGPVSTMPETKTYSDVIQKSSWNFLTLPEPLLAKLAQDFNAERGILPYGWVPGIDRTIPTISQVAMGTVVYARTDFPDSFAYDTAKALDEHQDRLLRTNQIFFYDVHKVGKACDVPLHPGAARYYKEVGYLK
jgi:uncharacterized protein